MDEPTRRAWSRPELIVLVRGRPEEAVLTACKDGTRKGHAGPSFENFTCEDYDVGCSTTCNTKAAS